MAKENLTQMTNRVTLQGTLMNNTLEVKVDKNGRKYLSGEVEVLVDNGYIVPVSVFSFETKASGEKNRLYERLLKICDLGCARTLGIGAAPKVSITNARIEDNSFYSEREGKVVNNWRISGAFINSAATDADTKNEFEAQGVISSIKEIVNKEGEGTDSYILKLLNVGYGNRVNELNFRFSDKEAIDYINSNYNVGDTVTLCGKVIYEQTERVVEKELGFGEPIKQTYTNTIRLLKITAGSAPQDAEESGYVLKDLQGIVAKQNNEITERYNARSQVVANTTTVTSAAGSNLLF